MLDFPTAVMTYLLNFMIEKRSLAYLLVEKNGCLSSWGGNLSVYGLSNLSKGERVQQQIFFLEGLLPLEDFPLFLPRLKTEDGICADVHIFPSDEGDWVVFLDATLEDMQITAFQQHANNTFLLQEKLTKIDNQ